MTNVLRHSHAGHFQAQLAFDARQIRLDLSDNGRGFDPAGTNDGFGLVGVRERVEGMGGQLSIQSERGKGARILILLPLAGDNRVSTR